MIIMAGRAFVARRRSRLNPRFLGAAVHHAVTPNCRPALCGAEPGASSWWAEPPGEAVTCPACLRRMQLLLRIESGAGVSHTRRGQVAVPASE